METLFQLIENAIGVILEDVNRKVDSQEFQTGLEQYFAILKPSINRYEHHQGSDISDEDLRKRYENEIALLHILTNILKYNLSSPSVTWPIYEADSPYQWYQPPPNIFNLIASIYTQLSKFNAPALILSQISGQILDKASKRYLGEFYTPLSLAEHLVDLSGLHPDNVLNAHRVIDPACGGGIILTLIANQVLLYTQRQYYSPEYILQSLSQNLFGFDIQPFAVFVTRSLLIYTCLPLLTKLKSEYPSSLFPNIRLQDTLTTYNEYWSERENLFQYLSQKKGFHYIIGNPPFMSAKGQLLDYRQYYEDVLYGHPNLYQLFLWWAVRAAVQDGIISFLLPQSMLTGNYFKKLREQLNYRTSIVSLTRMIDRKGVVGDADLQMMAVCLKVGKSEFLENAVNIRVVRNGTDISLSKPYQVNQGRVVQQIKESPAIWVVSDKSLDYTICDKLEAKAVILDELRQVFTCGNGSFVWNQHKQLLRETEQENTIPLISAVSIDLYGFTFPYTGTHPSYARPFSIVDDSVRHKIHSEPVLLIQRTTPRKVGRRIVAGMPSSQFHEQYPCYFLENHVNYIKTDNEETKVLYGLLGWLNSDLINFVFQLRNGTTLVSVYELGLLPVNLEIIKQLAIQTEAILASSGHTQLENIKDLNNFIFDWLELDAEYRNRIESVLSLKEKVRYGK